MAARSGWYRTPAYPAGSGPDYVNGAAALRAAWTPEAVLAALHAVEAGARTAAGRRWGPRVCDLDLIASGDAVLPDAETVRGWIAREGERRMETPPGLILPHPRLQERGFVLRPLADIAPDWRHPLLGAERAGDAGGAAAAGSWRNRPHLAAVALAFGGRER